MSLISLLVISALVVGITTFISFKLPLQLKSKNTLNILLILTAVFHALDIITRYFIGLRYEPWHVKFRITDAEYGFTILTLLIKLIPIAIIVFVLLCLKNKIKLADNIFLSYFFIANVAYFVLRGINWYSGRYFFYKEFIFSLPAFLFSVIAAVLLFKKHSKSQLFSILAITLYTLPQLLNTYFYTYNSFYYYYVNFCEIFAFATFILTVISIILIVKNSSIAQPIPTKATAALTPEQELLLLKEKLELNVITEEEYQTKRAEIISKL